MIDKALYEDLRSLDIINVIECDKDEYLKTDELRRCYGSVDIPDSTNFAIYPDEKDLDYEMIKLKLNIQQAKHAKTIKNCLIFFTILICLELLSQIVIYSALLK